MAKYTATLSQNFPTLATYYDATTVYSTTSYMWDPIMITTPKWKSGRRKFAGYYSSAGNLKINENGIVDAGAGTANVSWTERWTVKVAGAFVMSGANTIADYAYADGVWYQDYPNRTLLDATHPIEIPTKERYRFLGIYSTNATTGTKYIDENGYPTSAFLALAPTGEITTYAQFELISYRVTFSHASGSPSSTVIYKSIANGKFYADSECETEIDSVTPPSRELYRWNGAYSSSTQTAANQLIDSSGNILQNLRDAAITSDKTYSYSNNWTQVSYKITISPNSGTASVLAYYTDKTNGGIYTDWLCETTALDYFPIPSRSTYRFLGYYSSTTGGTQFALPSGEITSALKTQKATDTIYARWLAKTRTITLNPNGGTGGGTIYYEATTPAFFDEQSATITSVTPPTYTGNAFNGYYDAQSGGNQCILPNGTIASGYVPSGNDTLYAQWTIGKSTITIEQGEGSGGTTKIYYDIINRTYCADDELTTPITSVTLPSLRLFNTNGIYTESSGGNQVIGANGTISSSWHPMDEFVTVYAQFTRRCYEMVLNANGGTTALFAAYHAPSSSSWYSDETLTTAITNVGATTRIGYTFSGYNYGASNVISASGDIQPSAAIDADYVATASWTANSYTLYFNGNGGTPSYPSKSVTYGVRIGALPGVGRPGKTFAEWRIDNVRVTSAKIWSWAEDKTAIARYESDAFGGVDDYFDLESTYQGYLIAESSQSGENVPRTFAYNLPSESPATDSGSTLLNPTVTYRVAGDFTFTATLGKAYTRNNCGYMITSVTINTTMGEAPTVTVTATANEGADAVQTYPISVSLSRRHRPQNLLNAISGGGQLQSFTLTALCDPVVVAEGGTPVASDVTHGRLEASATTGAFANEGYPSAGSGFVDMGMPLSRSGTGYKTWSVRVRKEL